MNWNHNMTFEQAVAEAKKRFGENGWCEIYDYGNAYEKFRNGHSTKAIFCVGIGKPNTPTKDSMNGTKCCGYTFRIKGSGVGWNEAFDNANR